MRPKLRRSIVMFAAGTVALGVGYLCGRIAPATVPMVAPPESKTAGQAVTATPPSDSSPLPDPERARPQDVKELVKEVQDAMDYLLSVFPNSPDALEMRARTEQWLGRTNESMRLWQQCLELDASYVHAYVGMAQTAADKGEHERASEFAQRAIEIDPANFQARVIRADALIHLRRPADAVVVLEDHVKLDPRSQAFYLLGQAYLDLKQFDKARENVESAIEKYPEYAEAYYLLSRIYRELGNEQQADRRLVEYRKLATPERMVLRNRPRDFTDLDQMRVTAAVLYHDAGRMFMLRGSQADAEVFWRRAARLDQKNVPCRQSLAFLCRNNNRLGETIIWFNELADIEAANFVYWMEIGRLYEELSAPHASEKAFQKACEAAPEKAEGFAALADLLLRHDRDPSRAVTLAVNAEARDPSPENIARLAAAYLSNGENVAALEAIQRAMRLAPQSASYRAVFDAIKKNQ